MNLIRIAGHPFIDFINTNPVAEGRSVELIVSVDDLRTALFELGFLDEPDYELNCDKHVRVAQELREDFRELLLADKGFRVSRDDNSKVLRQVNRWVSQIGENILTRADSEYVIAYQNGTLPKPLVQLLRSGIELLCSEKYKRVRKCSNPACVLWYLDTTKSRTRSWCSMSTCGNLSKARTFRNRHKTTLP